VRRSPPERAGGSGARRAREDVGERSPRWGYSADYQAAPEQFDAIAKIGALT
jgi:hypothetical protein